MVTLLRNANFINANDDVNSEKENKALYRHILVNKCRHATGLSNTIDYVH